MRVLYTEADQDPFDAGVVDPDLVRRWEAFETLPADSLGRAIWEMYSTRGFVFPGAPRGAPAYLAQHDFVHVIADYGTQLEGELEVFTLIGRADPDPRGFAWLATVVDRPVDEVRALLHVPAKGPVAAAAGSPGVRDLAGMSETQSAVYESADAHDRRL